MKLDPKQYPEPGELKRALKNAIGARKLLLVLDDIWDGGQAEMLHCGGPNCAHLLTSRDNSIAAAFAGGAQDALQVPELDVDRAFSLLQRIAGAVVAADEQEARALVGAVGGLPLAVELLGGYLVQEGAPDPGIFPDLGRERLQALGDPALRLGQAKAKLEDFSGKEIRIDDLLALSLEGFSEEERVSFYALGAFAPKPATFERLAAEAVSGADGSFLSRLVNRSLLEIASGALALHQVLHDLAKGRMAPAAQARHGHYYLALANEDRSNWRRIDAAYEQIRWAWERIGDDDCLEWIAALEDHQRRRGYWAEAARWQERGLARAREKGGGLDLAWLLDLLAGTYDHLGRRAEALRLFEEALPLRREVGDRTGEAVTLNNMAAVYDGTGRPVEALRLYEEALPLRRAVGDRAGEAATLNNMGEVYRSTGRPVEALRLYEEAQLLRRAVGDRAGEAATLNNMAAGYRQTGRPAEALRLYEEALPLRRAVGDRAGEAATLNNIGMVYQGMGRPAEALRLYEEALLLRREVGDRAGEATTLANLAMLYRELGQIARAVEHVELAITLFRGGLTHDAAGGTVEQYEEFLQELQK